MRAQLRGGSKVMEEIPAPNQARFEAAAGDD